MSAANTTKGHRHHRHRAHHYCQSVNSHQSKDKSYYSSRSELEAGFDQAWTLQTFLHILDNFWHGHQKQLNDVKAQSDPTGEWYFPGLFTGAASDFVSFIETID